MPNANGNSYRPSERHRITSDRVVLEWAKAHPNDERLPEALHLVVTRGRLGCTTSSTASISKQAFDLLHTRYPDSPWTKKTPY